LTIRGTGLNSEPLQSSKKGKNAGIPRINIRKLAVAATILVLIGISSFLGIQLKNLSEYDQTMYEISVPLGARTISSCLTGQMYGLMRAAI
jgi:hypothetical protein